MNFAKLDRRMTVTIPAAALAAKQAIPLVPLLLLTACSSSGLEGVPEMGAAAEAVTTKLDDAIESTRELTIYLQLDSESGFQLSYADRMVVAQPVVRKEKQRAEGVMLVQGIETVIVGASCEELQQRYPEAAECALIDSVEPTFGNIQSTATTDQEGFASLQVGLRDVRVSVTSWTTVEDEKCHWSGSVIAKTNVKSIALPLVVYCE